MTTAPINRVQQHFTENLPTNTDVYGDAVLAALALLHRLTNSFDTDVAFKAAMVIVDLEKTRLRHKQLVTGMKVPEKPIKDSYDPVEEKVDAMRRERTEVQTGDFEEDEIPLTDEQEAQFEQMVDEGLGCFNEKRAAKRESLHSRDQMCAVYDRMLCEHGFAEMVLRHQLMLKRHNAAKPAPSTPAQPDWPPVQKMFSSRDAQYADKPVS